MCVCARLCRLICFLMKKKLWSPSSLSFARRRSHEVSFLIHLTRHSKTDSTQASRTHQLQTLMALNRFFYVFQFSQMKLRINQTEWELDIHSLWRWLKLLFRMTAVEQLEKSHFSECKVAMNEMSNYAMFTWSVIEIASPLSPPSTRHKFINVRWFCNRTIYQDSGGWINVRLANAESFNHKCVVSPCPKNLWFAESWSRFLYLPQHSRRYNRRWNVSPSRRKTQ